MLSCIARVEMSPRADTHDEEGPREVMIEEAPNVVTEDGLRGLLGQGYRAEVVCKEGAEKRHNSWYGTWTVRAGGAVLGESQNALELHEGDHPAVIYFPRDDIAMAFLDKTDKVTHCPHKGDASYYSVVTKSQTLNNTVWGFHSSRPCC